MLVVDLHGQDDGEHDLLRRGTQEQAGYLRLTGRESPLHRLRNRRLRQGPADGRPGLDDLLHVAIDDRYVAALARGQRSFGLALELGEVASVQRRGGGPCAQSLDLTGDLTINVRRQSPCRTPQFLANLA